MGATTGRGSAPQAARPRPANVPAGVWWWPGRALRLVGTKRNRVSFPPLRGQYLGWGGGGRYAFRHAPRTESPAPTSPHPLPGTLWDRVPTQGNTPGRPRGHGEQRECAPPPPQPESAAAQRVSAPQMASGHQAAFLGFILSLLFLGIRLLRANLTGPLGWTPLPLPPGPPLPQSTKHRFTPKFQCRAWEGQQGALTSQRSECVKLCGSSISLPNRLLTFALPHSGCWALFKGPGGRSLFPPVSCY